MAVTPNLNLYKPDGEDYVSLSRDLNENYDKIDTAVGSNSDAIAKVDAGLAIIVSGDSCTQAVPAGGYAYIKNNTHGLAEGLYKNKSSSSFPTSGGTANSTVFEAVSEGGLNALNSKLTTPKYSDAVAVTFDGNNQYTVPSNGYIWCQGVKDNDSAESHLQIQATIGNETRSLIRYKCSASAIVYITYFVAVEKGMILTRLANINVEGSGYMRFIPAVHKSNE